MTKRKLSTVAAIGLFLLGATAVQADILSPGMDSKDAINQVKSMETVDGFSAQFWITTEEQIFASWARNTAIRDLKPTISAKRNTPIYLALFIANPGVRLRQEVTSKVVHKISDVTFDMYIITPMGHLTLATKQRIGWRGTAPAAELVFLARDRGTIAFEAIDPLGEYTIAMVVHDNVKKTDIKLVRKLNLVD